MRADSVKVEGAELRDDLYEEIRDISYFEHGKISESDLYYKQPDWVKITCKKSYWTFCFLFRRFIEIDGEEATVINQFPELGLEGLEVGDYVNVNGKPLKEGKYRLSLFKKIRVKDGRIKSISMF